MLSGPWTLHSWCGVNAMSAGPADRVLIIGTRQHYGVGGCMFEELTMRGEPVTFIEVAPAWSRGLAHRVVARMMGELAPRLWVANAVASRMATSRGVRYAIVTNGRELKAATISELREVFEGRGGGIACFLCDDPFNPVHRSESWLSALREYSLVVSTKRAVIPDLRTSGCRRVAYARFAYHPPIHRPVDSVAMGFKPCDVAFAGNADVDRLPILAALAQRATDLSLGIYGHGWSAHPALRGLTRPQVTGLQYSAAMRAATVCPCLVRRANRDGHVMRSIELPAMGAFMLAERTEEHQAMFDEGVHCDYWSTVDELVDKTRWYAKNPRRAAEIARAGYTRVTTAGNTYADRAEQVVNAMRI